MKMELRYKLWCETCHSAATGVIKTQKMAEDALEASDHPHKDTIKIIAFNQVVKDKAEREGKQ